MDSTDVAVPPGQPVRRNPRPVKNLQGCPVKPDEGKVPLLEAAGRGDDSRAKVNEAARAAEPLKKVQILEEGQGPEAADLVVHVTADEKPRVAVRKAQQAERGINAREQAGGKRGAVKEESKVASGDRRIA